MAMTPDVIAKLKEKEVGESLDSLTEHVKNLLRMSSSAMKKYHATWDHHDKIFRGETELTEEEKAAMRKAKERGEPVKMVVPLAFSQVMTFASLIHTLFTQRDYVFEQRAKGAEDVKAAGISEQLLERDLDYSRFRGSLLWQWLIDIGRFGLGVIKHGWHEERKMDTVQDPNTGTFSEQDVLIHQGNILVNTSPYRFYPDTRFPLTRFQDGEFVASDDMYSRTQVEEWNERGTIAGLEHVTELKRDAFGDRRVFAEGTDNNKDKMNLDDNLKALVLITEFQIKIIPSKYMIGDKPLGDEKFPIKYLIWLANDDRIVRLEPMGYVHNRFTYDLGLFMPDQHHLLWGGLADVLDELQDTVSWHISSRIEAVRKTLNNFLVVDPKGIEMQDLHDRNPIIRLKGHASAQGIDRWIKQLNFNDVTGTHIQDAEILKRMAQETTGITENLMGSYSPGRRSAQEARNVGGSAIGRVKTIASLLWEDCVKQLGMKMLSNLRDGLTAEVVVAAVGLSEAVDVDNAQNPLARLQSFKASRDHLAGNYDFVPFDGTLPSEKQLIAERMEEMAKLILVNPTAAMLLGMDPRKLMKEVWRLMGVKNFEDFALPQDVSKLMSFVALNQLTGGLLNAQAQTGGGAQGGPSGAPNGMAPSPMDGGVPQSAP